MIANQDAAPEKIWVQKCGNWHPKFGWCIMDYDHYGEHHVGTPEAEPPEGAVCQTCNGTGVWGSTDELGGVSTNSFCPDCTTPAIPDAVRLTLGDKYKLINPIVMARAEEYEKHGEPYRFDMLAAYDIVDAAWHSRDAEVNRYQGNLEDYMKRANAADAEAAQLQDTIDTLHSDLERTADGWHSALAQRDALMQAAGEASNVRQQIVARRILLKAIAAVRDADAS